MTPQTRYAKPTQIDSDPGTGKRSRARAKRAKARHLAAARAEPANTDPEGGD